MGSGYDNYIPALPHSLLGNDIAAGTKAAQEAEQSQCPQGAETPAKACLSVFIDQHTHAYKLGRALCISWKHVLTLSVIEDLLGRVSCTGKGASLPQCLPSMKGELSGKLRPDTSNSSTQPHCPSETHSGSPASGCSHCWL